MIVTGESGSVFEVKVFATEDTARMASSELWQDTVDRIMCRADACITVIMGHASHYSNVV